MSTPCDAGEHLLVGDHRQTLQAAVEVHCFAVRVPAKLRWFEGHFEGNPVLPAMVQLRETLLLVVSIWSELTSLRRVSRAKFRRPIRPADALDLELRHRAGTPRVQFEYRRNGESCSSAVLEFAVSASTAAASHQGRGE